MGENLVFNRRVCCCVFDPLRFHDSQILQAQLLDKDQVVFHEVLVRFVLSRNQRLLCLGIFLILEHSCKLRVG